MLPLGSETNKKSTPHPSYHFGILIETLLTRKTNINLGVPRGRNSFYTHTHTHRCSCRGGPRWSFTPLSRPQAQGPASAHPVAHGGKRETWATVIDGPSLLMGAPSLALPFATSLFCLFLQQSVPWACVAHPCKEPVHGSRGPCFLPLAVLSSLFPWV